jgi:predicted amidohydrolase YtcJ
VALRPDFARHFGDLAGFSRHYGLFTGGDFMIIADTVFVNGKVAAIDAHATFHRSIAIKDGWIIDIGQNADTQRYIGEKTRVVDLDGKLVMPGLHDAHTHVASWGCALVSCDCGTAAVKSLDDLRARLANYAAKLKPGEWLRGDGLDPEALAASLGRQLNHHDIDDVTPYNPVVIQDCYAHSAFANALTMKIAGVTKDTPNPDGGRIDRLENGEPSGMFHEAGGTYLIMKELPQWSEQELREVILKTQRFLNENGYTSYTESTLGPANNQREAGRAGQIPIFVYKQLEEEGLLTCRVAIGFYTGENGFQSSELMEEQMNSFPFPEFNNPSWLKMEMAKIFCDGVHLSHTAWMLDDYPDTPGNHGSSALGSVGASDDEQKAELHKMILCAHKHGFQVGIHAIGDMAVEACIEGFIKAYQEYPGRDLRHYVIHPEGLCSNRQAALAAKYGIVFSVQPGMGAYIVEPTAGMFGVRGERAFGMKEILDHGVIAAGGFDAISGPYPRWQDAVRFCVTRRTVSGKVYAPELAISVEQAIRLYTINAAFQEHREHMTGSLEIGKAADLVVLDQDIFTAEHDKIGNTQVLMTMVGGKTVYEK